MSDSILPLLTLSLYLIIGLLIAVREPGIYKIGVLFIPAATMIILFWPLWLVLRLVIKPDHFDD